SSFLLRRGDEGKPVEGLPELPEPYRSAIRSVALTVHARTVERLRDRKNKVVCWTSYRIELDRGAESGLMQGMLLSVAEPDSFERLTISSVDRQGATGEMQIMEDDCQKPMTVPTADWTFTTGAYDPAHYQHMTDELARHQDE